MPIIQLQQYTAEPGQRLAIKSLLTQTDVLDGKIGVKPCKLLQS
jgi:hypothetical protein